MDYFSIMFVPNGNKEVNLYEINKTNSNINMIFKMSFYYENSRLCNFSSCVLKGKI